MAYGYGLFGVSQVQSVFLVAYWLGTGLVLPSIGLTWFVLVDIDLTLVLRLISIVLGLPGLCVQPWLGQPCPCSPEGKTKHISLCLFLSAVMFR